jgi:hypothetical protein
MQQRVQVYANSDLVKQYGSLPLRTLLQYVRFNRSLVTTVTRRRARGEHIPRHCGPDWVYHLACQVELAEMVTARRIIALPALRTSHAPRQHLAHSPN